MSETEAASIDEQADDDWAAAMAEQSAAEGSSGADAEDPDTELKPEAESAAGSESEVTPAVMDDLAADGNPNESAGGLDNILDIPVTISVEIGTTQVSIRNLLKLNQGSVVELDRLAGEPLDILVNGTLIAHGEVVVVNEKFGIRLTDVVSAQERVRKLQ